MLTDGAAKLSAFHAAQDHKPAKNPITHLTTQAIRQRSGKESLTLDKRAPVIPAKTA
jgi:hypothetical protein